MLKLAKLFLLLILLTPFDAKGAKNNTVIVELSQMYQSAMTYIFKNQPLINTYKKVGFVEGGSYTQEMIKKIDNVSFI